MQICPKDFAEFEDLEKHAAKHVAPNNKPLRCQVCPFSLISTRKSQSLQCSRYFQICSISFSHRHTLRRHWRNKHSSEKDLPKKIDLEKTHKCNVCSKSFARKDTLQKHLFMHTGLKPYSCKVKPIFPFCVILCETEFR